MPRLGGLPERGAVAHIGILVFVAAAYYLAGRLALLLAIPPGYATAVWPAAGLALAFALLFGARVWPGLWLGSFLVNVGTELAPQGITLASASIAASIGVGAALQGVLGAALVRRFAGYPNPLEEENSILRFLGLGGPVGCCVGATWGIGTLLVAGALPAEQALRNWSTWWVGDTIGVIIFAPLVLLWGAGPGQRREGRWAVTLPLCLTFVVSVVVCAAARRAEDRRVAFAFERQALEVSRRVERAVAERLQVVEAVQAFFASVPEVDRASFRTFVGPLLARHSGVFALEWVPRVRAGERDRYEAAAARDGIADFRIRERGGEERVVPAGPRPEYFPVYYAEPQERNARALGFDLASDPERRRALHSARDRGALAATPRVHLVQDPGAPHGFLVYGPLYAGGQPPATLEARREQLRGFALGVFRLPDLIDAALADGPFEGVAVGLLDVTGREAPLYASDGPPRPSPAAAFAREFQVADRRWVLRAESNLALAAAANAWLAWTALAGALFLTGLLGALLLVVTGRSSRAARIAAELNAANERLYQLTAKLGDANQELSQRNAELDDFAQIVSHDLRAPLRGIRALAEWISKDHYEAVGPDGREHLQLLQGRAARMQDLIEGVLSYSRAARTAPRRRPVESGRIAADVIALLDAEPRASVRVEGELPVVEYDETQLQQVLQNLIHNAIRHSDKERCEVVVSCRDAGEAWEFSVRDDGPGIDERHFDRIFKMFQTLRPSDEAGTVGVGLSIVKKIVERNGGAVTVRSSPGAGSEFLFSVPKPGSGVAPAVEAPPA